MDQRTGEEVALKQSNTTLLPENTEAALTGASVPLLSLPITGATTSPISSNVNVGKMMDIPHPQGVGGVQPSDRKRKTTRTTNTSQGGIVQPKRKRNPHTSSTSEVGKVQPNRKRNPCTTSIPEVGIVQPTSGGNQNSTPNPSYSLDIQPSCGGKQKSNSNLSNALEVDGGDPSGTSELRGVQLGRGRKRKDSSPPTDTPDVQPNCGAKKRSNSNLSNALEGGGADPNGTSEVRIVMHPGSGRKRKGNSCPTNTPDVRPSCGEKKRINSNLSNALEVDRSDPNGTSEVQASGGILDGEEILQTPEVNLHLSADEFLQDYGDSEEGEDAGGCWDNTDWDMDEDDRAGCVEGQINLEIVDTFLHGEENKKFRSKVWKEFTKIRVGGIVTKGQCIHCKTKISARRGSGTSAMSTHLKRCRVRKSITNVARQLKSAVVSPEGVALENWRFSQDVSRRELARMISLHGFPLSIVDYDGFRRFISSLNPVFKMISRRTISIDCLKAFEEQKQSFRDVLKTTNGRVSLTMDMWTSNQNLGYMCITCHFIDDDWKIQKRIIKFSFLKTPHTGVAMFNAVLKCIQEWNIEDKLFAITLDNASNNNAMVKLLRGNLLEKNMLCGKGKLLHYRCAGHVLNLTCKAGFGVIDPIVYKIRESVKFIEGSTSRKQKFEEIIQQLGIAYQKRPKIDISTRWNSTYLMLETCLQLRRAFDSLAKQDQEYTFAPSHQEWEKVRMVCGFLKTFYDATLVVSGSHYPIANLHFQEIWEVKIALENVVDVNSDLLETVEYMQRKFKRYWKLTWLQIMFPVIFDPRFKLAFVEFRLKQSFGSEADSKISTMKKVLLELFKGYSQVNLESQEMTQHTASAEVVTDAISRYADWDHHISSAALSRSEVSSDLELETYLVKPPIPRSDTFDILAWWKSNSSEYPTLSRMARDILAVPASTVASESAFSMGRRIISDFRSRLTSKTVEALMCLQDWMRASSPSQFCMKGIDDFIDLPDEQE